jgi:hypothetical protein
VNPDLGINFESLVVLGTFIQFLETNTQPATEFLYSVLSRKIISDKALTLLVRGSDFEKRLWDLATNNPNGVKPPMALCDFIMNKESKFFRSNQIA